METCSCGVEQPKEANRKEEEASCPPEVALCSPEEASKPLWGLGTLGIWVSVATLDLSAQEFL
jgi:hypothetical protein